MTNTGLRARRVATLVIAPAIAITALAGSAHAAGNVPPWEPDPNAAAPYGNLTFQDANGNQITGGNNLSNLFYSATATTPNAPAGAQKATLYYAAPDHTQPDPQTWYTAQDTTSATYTYTTSTTSTANPVDVVGTTGADLSAFLQQATFDTTAGYANIVEVRVYTSGKVGRAVVSSNPSYWESDIAYNPSTATSSITVDGATIPPGSWAEVYPLTGTVPTPPTTVPEFANPAALVGGGTGIAALAAFALRRRRKATA